MENVNTNETEAVTANTVLMQRLTLSAVVALGFFATGHMFSILGTVATATALALSVLLVEHLPFGTNKSFAAILMGIMTAGLLLITLMRQVCIYLINY